MRIRAGFNPRPGLQEGGASRLSDVDPWAMVPCTGGSSSDPTVYCPCIDPEPGLGRAAIILATPQFVEES